MQKQASSLQLSVRAERESGCLHHEWFVLEHVFQIGKANLDRYLCGPWMTKKEGHLDMNSEKWGSWQLRDCCQLVGTKFLGTA